MKSKLFPYALTAFFASSVRHNDRVAVLAAAEPTAAISRPATASLHLHEEFLSKAEIDALMRGIDPAPAVEAADDDDDDSAAAAAADTYYEPVLLPHDIADRLRHLGGTCGAPGGRSNKKRGTPVMTMLMTATTDRHRDCYVPQREGKVVMDDVAFVFLESDSDARFEHGTASVPVVAGNLVRFRGDVPHRTFVPPGSKVRIAGPFHLRTLEYVGSCPQECKDAGDCDGGEFFSECICTTLTERRRLDAKEKGMDDLESLERGEKFLRAMSKGRDLEGANVGGTDYWDDFIKDAEQNDRDICVCKEATGSCRVGNQCYDNFKLSTCTFGMRGTFHGKGSKCDDPSQGIRRGPCCFSDRRDMNFQEEYCELMTDGHFIGEGMSHHDCPPNSQYGACCFDTGCKRLTETLCLFRGGDFKGVGTRCKDHCFGACCSPTECKIVTETGSQKTCKGQGANFVGVGTDCMAGTCPTNCEATLKKAESLTFPDEPNKVELVGGDSAVTGQVYKGHFPECGATILPSNAIWYNLVNPGFDRRVTISTCEEDVEGAYASFKSSLTVQEGSCTDLSCVDEIYSTETKRCERGATIEFCAESRKEYHILVHGFDTYCATSSGRFILAVRDEGYADDCGPPPTESPISIDEGTTTTTTTTTTHGEWDCTDEETIFGCPNPCQQGMHGADAFRPFCDDDKKYFHCGYWGGCTLMECCDPNTFWNDSIKACDHITNRPV